MKEFFGAGLELAFFVFLLLLAPLILLASANAISEQAQLGWYIPHNFWTYLSSYGLVFVLKGSCTSSKD